ncbi:hypothetical protein P280DRAFT_473987 [Massarina eburnea CBS 473.64]|uniref:Uncharacterized protein n=1 Tax=Massarina eburnea CBS 473.64 TaxID=1395130 RepID=A0A6A6RJ99_9PLEO|nr:hypothetical protein P280DRAFT_473987 [Massarina eburnea CBS 473.64]
MFALWYIPLVLSNPLLAFAQVTPTSSITPQPTFCGDIIRKTKQNSSRTMATLEASEVFECLSSVPFNSAVASRFIKYFNDTLQFHSTLAYVKNPPKGYQQPSVDLVHELGVIQDRIDRSQFRNEYQFEEAVQQVIYSAHDKHLQLNAGVLSAFRFSSPIKIVSLSSNGKEPPRLYLLEDSLAKDVDWNPSPISTINSVNAEEYLTSLGHKHSPGNLDPHADWNALMYSPAQNISGANELFRDLVLYPGDTIQITLENGTATPRLPFEAKYVENGPTGPLETGGDFYNYFVLGYYPSGFFEKNIQPLLDAQKKQGFDNDLELEVRTDFMPEVSSSPLSGGWTAIDESWPNPNLLQGDFDRTRLSMISGYFLDGTDLAVLSIPTFNAQGYAIDTFSSAIDSFIEESMARGKSRLIIDLQRNGGGSPTLAIDTFRRFFPDIEPNMETRIRAHDMAEELGRMTDEMFREWQKESNPDDDTVGLLYEYSSKEWVVSNRINPTTNNTFANWTEFFGPVQEAGDNFTNIQSYNFSDPMYDTRSLAFPETLHITYGYPGARPAKKRKSFAATNITLLTDGLCESSCALFVEMMRLDAGAKAIAVGGRPTQGPMQATGTRGARQYTLYDLDYDIELAKQYAGKQYAGKEQVTSLPERDNTLFYFSAAINIRDFIRKGQQLPLQFVYDAADCRLYYTKDTLFNQTALWMSAAEAIKSPERLCVSGSTSNEPPTPVHNTTSLNTAIPTTDPDLGGPLKDEIYELGDEGTRAVDRVLWEDITGTNCTNSNGVGIEDLYMACVEVPECKPKTKGQQTYVWTQRCTATQFCPESNMKLTGRCNVTRDESEGYCILNPATVCSKGVKIRRVSYLV